MLLFGFFPVELMGLNGMDNKKQTDLHENENLFHSFSKPFSLYAAQKMKEVSEVPFNTYYIPELLLLSSDLGRTEAEVMTILILILA